MPWNEQHHKNCSSYKYLSVCPKESFQCRITQMMKRYRQKELEDQNIQSVYLRELENQHKTHMHSDTIKMKGLRSPWKTYERWSFPKAFKHAWRLKRMLLVFVVHSLVLAQTADADELENLQPRRMISDQNYLSLISSLSLFIFAAHTVNIAQRSSWIY